MVFNTHKLESLLLTNWSEFLDPRKLIAIAGSDARQITDVPIKNVSITRFELTESGFILWVEFKTSNQNFTSEYKLLPTGLKYIRTV